MVFLQVKKSRFQTKKDNSPKTNDSVGSEKKKSGFSLYLEENKEQIKSTASSEATDKDIIKMAVQLYRELPKSEKQVILIYKLLKL